MVHHERPSEVELYHLPEDPTESTNLAVQNPAKVSELQRALVAQKSLDP